MTSHTAQGPTDQQDSGSPAHPTAPASPAAPQTGAVLRSFVRDGRLNRLPVKRGKRLVVLEHVAAQSFTPGVEYAEPEVNEILRRWCEGGDADHAGLRRDLVEERILDRENSVYRLRDDRPTAPLR
ncbi:MULTISPECIES: DUF2087 domain-containing protein [Kitasatospora]|uniref:DUF2087 domain-containing protein n=1 Tax=Kitasatospora cystarginea TaxID=58350 RepID=A0ABP5QRM0_9ACTN